VIRLLRAGWWRQVSDLRWRTGTVTPFTRTCTSERLTWFGEAELADLQRRDADTIADAQAIADLARIVRDAARDGDAPDLHPLQDALDELETTLDRRKAAN
jgi:hypothetical protein